jgi:hypothetical protein
VQEGRGMAEPSDPHRGSWGAGCTPESRRCGGKTRLKQEERIVGELPKVEWCGTWKVVCLCCPLGPSNPHRGSWGAGCTPESSGKTRLKQGKRVAGELSKVEWCGTWKVVSLCCQNDVFHLTNFENYKKLNGNEILIKSCKWENFDNF